MSRLLIDQWNHTHAPPNVAVWHQRRRINSQNYITKYTMILSESTDSWLSTLNNLNIIHNLSS